MKLFEFNFFQTEDTDKQHFHASLMVGCILKAEKAVNMTML